MKKYKWYSHPALPTLLIYMIIHASKKLSKWEEKEHEQ